jgi:hypothetical protein
VRDVVVEPGRGDEPANVFGVTRAGDWLRMQLRGDALQHEVLLHEDCGLGRIAKARGLPGVHYLTRDDGVVLRVQIGADGMVAREPIFAGGQGLRGIASGRFCADGREAVAAYGYDQTVHLISRTRTGWQVETVFTSVQRGHWLAVGELDGRNGTDELIATGFEGDIVLLARPPGHALPGVAVPMKQRDEKAPAAPDLYRRVAAWLASRR